ncbi:MAG: ferredoxin [Candidatus Gracilibacteria bacterium]|nr:ferredoxin [Candidatus Gracilibacteria bacterium]
MTHQDQDPQSGDVYVNENCIGCSACVAICGQVFDLDDEGMAFPTKGQKQSSEVDDAISACPVNAIHYQD